MPPKQTKRTKSSMTSKAVEMIDTVLKAASSYSMPKVADWEAVAKELGLKNAQSARRSFYALCERQRWFVGEETNAEGSQPGTSSTPQRYRTRSIAKKEAEAVFDNAGSIEDSEMLNIDEWFDTYIASDQVQV
ncbi:hypothetical protein F4811DRAFT_261078 [Daldinia bambusicola]|nr:hypothetical protein F4811DRAFT_261078 [Daldinia bambusicola]